MPPDAGHDEAQQAGLAVALAVGAPNTFGGIRIVGAQTPARDALVASLGDTRRLPIAVDASRLLGGIDLTATLALGRPIFARGLLAEDAAPLVVPSAERIETETAALLAALLDGTLSDATGDPIAPRPILAFDEAMADDPPLDPRLAERLAFTLPSSARPDAMYELPPDWRSCALDDALRAELAALPLAFGVPSMRIAIQLADAAKAIAAIGGHPSARDEDAETAARLVLAPRARIRPDGAQEPPPPPQDASPDAEPPPDDKDGETETGEMADRLVDAIAASLDPAVLQSLAAQEPQRARRGRAGAKVKGARGRPSGVRAGVPGPMGRLALVETLTAAAPWRALRSARAGAIPVRKSDLRIQRTKARAATLTIFCVDASGSQALARMAEAKGAVETLLGQAYVRRDEVALVAFRRDGAEVLLPPTSSLTRAKRALAALPGGGGTPLAAGLLAAHTLARRALADGKQPTLVVLTDARANVTLAGEGGREVAREEATAAARRIGADRLAAVVIDTASRPSEPARRLAEAMGARYAPLAYAGPGDIAALASANRAR